MAYFIRLLSFFIMCFMAIISGCLSGGSSNDAPAGTSQETPASPPSITLSGVAANGAAISGTIYLRDANGSESSIVTTDGSYSFDITGLTPPFILKASWSESGVPMELYSMAVAGGTANISPLTQAIVMEAAGGNIAEAYNHPSPAALDAIADNLSSALSDFRKAFAPLILQYASSADIDPITDTFIANHQGLDKLLDDMEFTITSQVMSVASRVSGMLLYEAPATSMAQGISSILWDESDGAVAENPSVAVDSDGNGLVVWSQNDGTRNNIESKWLSGSGDDSRVSDGVASCAVPKVVFSPDGVAHAVWCQASNSPSATIWSARYVPGTGWTGRTQVSSGTGACAYYPDIAADGSGNAVAVWYEWSGQTNHFDVFASRYSAQTGTWSSPVMISSSSHSAYWPKVAMNAAGKAVAVWTQDAGDGSVSNDSMEIAASTLTSLSWSAPVKLNSISGQTLGIYPQVAVAVDSNGDALALWVQNYIHAARMVNNVWSASAPIVSSTTDFCYAPEVKFSSPGKAVGVWEQSNGISACIEAGIFDSAAGWTVTAVSQGDTIKYYPHVAVGSDGNATAAWMQMSATETSLMTARFITGSGWNSPSTIDTVTNDVVYINTPVSAVGSNNDGQSFVVWGLDMM